ncbi:MAG: RHS repeat protein [Betaproteobacteria bacterium]|nr:RHS repeat protein [Betaproteobacteria bacterium]
MQAQGQRKIGLFTLEYRDLNLPAAGIPLTLTRTYDSRDKTKRDFGVGWRLGLDTLRIRTNRVLGTGWVRNVAGPVVSLAPTSEHRVSVTLPDGTVEVFDMRVSPTANIGSLDFTAVTGFEPRPGALGTLEALANPDLLIVNGGAEEELVDDSTLETYQPKVYRYTTVDGTKIEISPTEGVKKVTDRNGNAVTFGPSGILHSDGTGIVFTRDVKGRIVTITDPAGHVQSYAYDGNDDLVAHTDPTGALSRYAYDRRHGLIEVRDALGTSRVRNDYDDTGRLIRMTDAAGNEINYAHDEGANTEIVTDRLGRQTRFVYDTQGNVLRRERGVTIEGVLVNAVTEFAYDGEGNPTSRSDPDGKRVVSSYVDRVPVSVSSDPSGLDLVTAYAYDPHRLLTGAVDPAGRSSSFGYDANGNLVSADLPGAPGLAFVNDASGQPVERRNALGTRAVATRDGSGRVTREEAFDAAATLLARVDYTYDANGNQTTVTRHRTIDGVLTALTTTYGWDAANRMVARTDPAGGTSRFDYDATGRQVAMVDALGRRTTTAYDVLGRMERHLPGRQFRSVDLRSRGQRGRVDRPRGPHDDLRLRRGEPARPHDAAGRRDAAQDLHGCGACCRRHRCAGEPDRLRVRRRRAPDRGHPARRPRRPCRAARAPALDVRARRARHAGDPHRSLRPRHVVRVRRAGAPRQDDVPGRKLGPAGLGRAGEAHERHQRRGTGHDLRLRRARSPGERGRPRRGGDLRLRRGGQPRVADRCARAHDAIPLRRARSPGRAAHAERRDRIVRLRCRGQPRRARRRPWPNDDRRS